MNTAGLRRMGRCMCRQRELVDRLHALLAIERR
jgi:hypothetical protein